LPLLNTSVGWVLETAPNHPLGLAAVPRVHYYHGSQKIQIPSSDILRTVLKKSNSKSQRTAHKILKTGR
jgi:hypothetical protein